MRLALVLSLLSACSIYTGDGSPDAGIDAAMTECEVFCSAPGYDEPTFRACVEACVRCEDACEQGPRECQACCAATPTDPQWPSCS